jgi:hypothetical protein
MGTGYLFSEDHSELAIDVSTDVGEHVAQVFTGLLAWQLGEDKFTVERVASKATAGRQTADGMRRSSRGY